MQQLRFIQSHPEVLFEVDGLAQSPSGVSGRMSVGAWAAGPNGRTAAGAVGVIADEVLGYALMASLPRGAWSISTEIWVDLVGELPDEGGILRGQAAAVQEGSFSVGRLYDERGRVVAECRQRGRSAPAPEGPLPPTQGSPPCARAGLETLLGLRADDGGFSMPVDPALVNPRAMLHGGVSLAASDVAAARTRLDAGCELRTSSVHIVHTRGVPLGALVSFRAETRHAGRTLWVTDVIGTVDGRTCTLATVTAQE